MFSFPGGNQRVVRTDFFKELNDIERNGVAVKVALDPEPKIGTLRGYLAEYREIISAEDGYEYKTATKIIEGELWVAIAKTDKRWN